MDAKTIEVINANLSEEDAAKVIAAIQELAVDPAVGTTARNAATGDVAVRVQQYGQQYWRVVSTDDRSWSEFEPIVGWDALYKPEQADAAAPPTDSGSKDPKAAK